MCSHIEGIIKSTFQVSKPNFGWHNLCWMPKPGPTSCSQKSEKTSIMMEPMTMLTKREAVSREWETVAPKVAV